MKTRQTFIGPITDLTALTEELEEIKARVDRLYYQGPDCYINLKSNRSFKRDFNYGLQAIVDYVDDALWTIEKYWGNEDDCF